MYISQPLIILGLTALCVEANIIWRFPRADGESQIDISQTWTPLGSAQDFYSTHTHVPRSLPDIEKEEQSYRFMEAPVSLSNPVFNVFSKMSDLYRWIANEKRSTRIPY